MYRHTDREHLDPRRDRGHLRSVGGFLVTTAIIGAVLLLSEFNHELTIVSDPVLDDLVAAQSRLDRSHAPEAHLLADSRAAHRELNGAIRQLDAAEQEFPTGNKQIDAARVRLITLENEGAEQMTSQELDARYRKLAAEIEGMIDARFQQVQRAIGDNGRKTGPTGL